MRVLVCGDRNYKDDVKVDLIATVLEGFLQNWCFGEDTVVIEGGAKGADASAAEWAELSMECPEPGFTIRHEQYPAEWDKHGKAAGPKRNQRMLDEGHPEVVLAFHDDLENSKGTADMVRRAQKAGVPVYNIRRIS